MHEAASKVDNRLIRMKNVVLHGLPEQMRDDIKLETKYAH